MAQQKQTERLRGMLFQLGFSEKATKKVLRSYERKPEETYKEVLKQYISMLTSASKSAEFK